MGPRDISAWNGVLPPTRILLDPEFSRPPPLKSDVVGSSMKSAFPRGRRSRLNISTHKQADIKQLNGHISSVDVIDYPKSCRKTNIGMCVPQRPFLPIQQTSHVSHWPERSIKYVLSGCLVGSNGTVASVNIIWLLISTMLFTHLLPVVSIALSLGFERANAECCVCPFLYVAPDGVCYDGTACTPYCGYGPW
jgi:hypothetical protein